MARDQEGEIHLYIDHTDPQLTMPDAYAVHCGEGEKVSNYVYEEYIIFRERLLIDIPDDNVDPNVTFIQDYSYSAGSSFPSYTLRISNWGRLNSLSESPHDRTGNGYLKNKCYFAFGYVRSYDESGQESYKRIFVCRFTPDNKECDNHSL